VVRKKITETLPISVCTLKNVLRGGEDGRREGRWENDKVRTSKTNSYNFSHFYKENLTI